MSLSYVHIIILHYVFYCPQNSKLCLCYVYDRQVHSCDQLVPSYSLSPHLPLVCLGRPNCRLSCIWLPVVRPMGGPCLRLKDKKRIRSENKPSCCELAVSLSLRPWVLSGGPLHAAFLSGLWKPLWIIAHLGLGAVKAPHCYCDPVLLYTLFVSLTHPTPLPVFPFI